MSVYAARILGREPITFEAKSDKVAARAVARVHLVTDLYKLTDEGLERIGT